jgi:hypothetical protein
MTNAVLWQLVEACQEKLRQELSFEAEGDDQIAPIEDEAIVIRKVAVRQREEDTDYVDENLPGILISLPGRVVWDSTAGENGRDEGVYPVLFQIIDKDYGDPEIGLRTHLKWQEQISRLFRSQPLSDPCEVFGTEVVNVDNVDERLWTRHNLFVAGVEVRFRTLEPRGGC